MQLAEFGLIASALQLRCAPYVISDDGHKPACTWLDQNHDNGIWAGAVQNHMQDFNNLSIHYLKDPGYYRSLPATYVVPNRTTSGGRANARGRIRRAMDNVSRCALLL